MIVKIYSTVYIKPEFIDLQYNLFTKYSIDNFELIIINNGIDNETSNKIIDKCKQYNLKYINVIKSNNNYEYCSSSHIHALDFTLQNYIKKDNTPDLINLIIDSDVFPYKSFSFIKLLNNKELSGIYQQRNEYDYISAIFMLIDSKLDLTDFTFYSGNGDTGAGVQFLMNKFNIIPEYLNHTAQIDIESDYIFRCDNKYPYKDKYRIQFIGDSFIHYYRGSNWQESDINYHTEKFIFLTNFLNDYESYCLNLDEYVNYPYAHSDKSYNGIDHNYHNYRYNNRPKIYDEMTLKGLFNNKGYEYYPTDKDTDHSYLDVYDKLFKDFKEKTINILEVGIWKGGSIRLWSDYFINAKIFGCDINDISEVFPENAIKIIKNFNNITLSDLNNLSLSIAIDDGSHSLDDQISFIKLFYPNLMSGGMLIIEDIQNIDSQKKDFDLLNIPYEIIDLRYKKNRYDDVLLIFKKI